MRRPSGEITGGPIMSALSAIGIMKRIASLTSPVGERRKYCHAKANAAITRATPATAQGNHSRTRRRVEGKDALLAISPNGLAVDPDKASRANVISRAE